MKVLILNGPNLNLLGEREPEIYGTITLAEVEKMCRERAATLGVDLDFRQTNHEGELIDWLQEARRAVDAVVLNPAAFTHYSLALRDAIAACDIPVIELHLSNIYAREQWRATSVISGVAAAVIAGLGPRGYPLAIEAATGFRRELGEVAPLPGGTELHTLEDANPRSRKEI
ncbi:MAG: type II 3-dehydroquinate dehydratase [Actinomycetota bacterium]